MEQTDTSRAGIRVRHNESTFRNQMQSTAVHYIGPPQMKDGEYIHFKYSALVFNTLGIHTWEN